MIPLGAIINALGITIGKMCIRDSIGHERQPVIQFFEERLGDEGVAPVELPPVQPAESAFHGQGAELVDVEIVHAHGQRFGPQARAVACGAIHALSLIHI